jgi:hypothetical protein
MPNFENFYNELLELVKRYEKNNIPIKVEKDLENNIIKIFGEQITSLARAKNGLNDVSELAFATAEHHPFWNLLYNCSEISSTILEKWNGALSKKDVNDLEWAMRELTCTLEKQKKIFLN